MAPICAAFAVFGRRSKNGAAATARQLIFIIAVLAGSLWMLLVTVTTREGNLCVLSTMVVISSFFCVLFFSPSKLIRGTVWIP